MTIVPSGTVVALISLSVTVVVGFASVLLKLGAIQQQLALLWAWYLAECGPGLPGGRRRTDPPINFASTDSGPVSGRDDTVSHRPA